MTQSEYDSLNGTLGLQLAVHGSFEENLVIVGMSLEDAYLREHIRSFRPQIAGIYWFVAEAAKIPTDIADWASANDVTIIEQQWDTFWQRVQALFPGPVQETRLVSAWLTTVETAAHELFGRSATWRDLAMRLRFDTTHAYDAVAVDELRWLARIRGEEGDEKMTDAEMSELPLAALPSVEPIRRAFTDAKRTDAFCRAVAESDTVFIHRDRNDGASAIDGAMAARDFWSTRDGAQIAINLMHTDRNRFFPVAVPWRSVAEGWRTNAAPPALIRVDESGDTDQLDMSANLVARQIEAIRSW